MIEQGDEYARIFAKRGHRYHAAMKLYPEARREEFRQLLKRAELNDGDVVYDIPSGGGYVQTYIENLVTPICVETAAGFFENRNADNHVPAVLCRLEALPFKACMADKVLSLAGLHHMSNLPGFFRRTYELLKPGGLYVLADAKEDSPPARFLDGFIAGANSQGHRGRYLSGRTCHALEAAGFVVESAEAVDYDWLFSSLQDMVEFCTLLFGIDQAGPAEVEKAIRRGLGIRQYGTTVAMAWGLYFITARKPG